MPQCEYPNCRQAGIHQPVVALPTFRTAGVVKPLLTPHINNTDLLAKMELDRGQLIRQYERMTLEYAQASNTAVQTVQPTYLIFEPVCTVHRGSFNLLDYIGRAEWDCIQEAARTRGIQVPEPHLIQIVFQPVGWTPGNSHIELERL